MGDGSVVQCGVQASQLLQANKSSLAHLDSICDVCHVLNSLQLERILRNFRTQDDGMRIPATLIDCVKGRAMNRADRIALEDGSSACRLQLTRNEDFVLPFHIAGPFHTDTGLVRTRRADSRARLRERERARAGERLRDRGQTE